MNRAGAGGPGEESGTAPAPLPSSSWLGSARSALGFLTVLGGARAFEPGMLAWFPVVGAGLGALLGGVWLGAGRLWPPVLAALVVVVADAGLTGFLHLDGLADCADGLLAPLDRQRRLAVMATPDLGAFGVGALVLDLGVRVGALATLHPSVLLLASLWLLSRSVMLLGALLLPSARPGGLAALVGAGARRGPALGSGVVGVLGSLGLAIAWRPLAGPVAEGAGVLAAAFLLGLARRRLGGVTGDVLGAAGVLVETLGLVAAAARW